MYPAKDANMDKDLGAYNFTQRASLANSFQKGLKLKLPHQQNHLKTFTPMNHKRNIANPRTLPKNAISQ